MAEKKKWTVMKLHDTKQHEGERKARAEKKKKKSDTDRRARVDAAKAERAKGTAAAKARVAERSAVNVERNKGLEERQKEFDVKNKATGEAATEPVKYESLSSEKKREARQAAVRVASDQVFAEFPTVDDALMALGVSGIFNAVGKLGFGAGAGARVAAASAGGKLVKKGVANTKTQELSLSYLGKLVKAVKNPILVVGAVGAMIGTYPWSEWALGEAKEGLIFNAGKVMGSGDVGLMSEYQDTMNDIFDVSFWENIARGIPFANIAFSFGEKAKSLNLQKKVNDAIIADEILAVETGEDDSAKWERIQARKLQDEKDAIDYYNAERKKMLLWEEEAADRDMREDAAFWKKQKELTLKMEKEAAEDLARFWTEYRKTAAKMAADSRPSNLKFGLL